MEKILYGALALCLLSPALSMAQTATDYDELSEMVEEITVSDFIPIFNASAADGSRMTKRSFDATIEHCFNGAGGWTDLTNYEPAGAAAAIIASSITESDTTHCPDGASVFTALAGKQATGSYLTEETDPGLATAGDADLGLTGGDTLANISGNAATDTINEFLADINTAVGSLGGGHDAVTLSVAADILLSLTTQEIGLDTQTANTVFAGPATGDPATPTMRSLVDADIPDDITITEADPVCSAWDYTDIVGLWGAGTGLLKTDGTIDTSTYLTSGDDLGSAAYTDIVALWASGLCTGLLYSDGTCVSLDSFTEIDPAVGAITGIVKADGAGNISAASAGTDYQAPITGGTDYLRPTTDVDDTPVDSETTQPVSSNWAFDHAIKAPHLLWQSANVNPDSLYTNEAGIFELAPKTPAALTVTEIYVALNEDPTNELTVTCWHKAAAIGYTGGTQIDTNDTVAGTFSATSTFDDATIPAGSKVWCVVDDDPDITTTHLGISIFGTWD